MIPVARRAAQLFAFLPYQLLLSVTFILFPMVARAHAQKDAEAVRGYVRTGLRLGVVLAGLMVSCTSGLAPELLRFAYPKEAADSAGLEVLGFASQAAFLIGAGIESLLSEGMQRGDTRQQATLAGEARRLLLPGEMGEIFKVIALGRGVKDMPLGFERGDRAHTL